MRLLNWLPGFLTGYQTSFVFCLLCFVSSKGFAIAHPRTVVNQDISTKKNRAQILKIKNESKQMEVHQPDSSIRLLQAGLRLSRQLNYRYGEALMFLGFAEVNEKYGNYKIAVKHQNEALNFFLKLNKNKEATAAQLCLGRLYGKMHLLDESSKWLRKILKEYEKSHDQQGQLQTLITLGNVNALNKNYEKALFFDRMADSLLRGHPVDTNNFILIDHMAQIQEHLGSTKIALENYEMGLSLSNHTRFASWHIAFLRKAGELWDKLGDSVNAGLMHEESLRKAREYHMPEAEIKSQMSWAMSLKDNNVQNSVAHLKKALAISKSIGSSRLTVEIFRSLSDLYQHQADYKQALTSLRQHQFLLDSLRIVDEGHRLALLEGSLELAENKIHIQNLELSAHVRKEQRNAGVIIIISLVILLGLITFYYFRTRTLNGKLLQANLTKDKLFSIIGHDLRNPIGGIVQLLELLDQQDGDSEESHHMIGLMKLQGKNALEILNALLNWGETQLKGIKVDNTIFSPQYFIQRNIELLDKQIKDKGLDISSQIPADLKVVGDANHFDFIIRNLLSNAIKFSFTNGRIEVLYSIIKDKRLQVHVQDHGKGVSKEQQLQFYNANMDVSYGTSGEKGTGLGLLLSKEFAKANGDMLVLKNTLGNGASFFFSFKIAAV